MALQFIVLKCPNCGASLEVCHDQDQFACGYCGSHILVERRGGTVSLKALTQAIERVQTATDKTAAELAIARYDAEAKEIRSRVATLQDKQNSEVGRGFGCGASLLVIGLFLWKLSGATAVILLIVAVFLIVRAFRRGDDPELEGMKRRLADLELRIAKKKTVADA
jgi:DNA-directed RNA polymerase subunit RPC12/RpoP